MRDVLGWRLLYATGRCYMRENNCILAYTRIGQQGSQPHAKACNRLHLLRR